MKITESRLRNIIRKAILENTSWKNEEGGIHPDWMEMFEWYQWDIIHKLEYWEEWDGLDYKFLEAQCRQSFSRNDVPSSVAFERKHNEDLFERALFELVASEEINSFDGRWHPKHDLDHDHSKPDWETPEETRKLFALRKGHKYQDDFKSYKDRKHDAWRKGEYDKLNKKLRAERERLKAKYKNK